jgi:hypothetical protein
MVQLYDVIKSGYDKKNRLEKQGYFKDNELSNHNKQVYFNPDKKDLIYNVSGSHTIKDWGTNLYLATGNIKKTNRYKEAHQGIRQAKQKYKVDGVKISGDSLGGTIAGYIGGKNDKVTTLNKGSTIGQKIRSNENGFRVENDIISSLNANSKHMKTLHNQNIKSPFTSVNAYYAHIPDSIKNHNIKI